VLAGFIYLVGLLHVDQSDLSGYALVCYKRASERGEFAGAWQFQRVTKARSVPIKFIGVWDTVASVIIPRKDRLYVPSLLTLPYTRVNPNVEIFRHAIAIDERRRMFRLNRWTEPQNYVPNRFDKSKPPQQQDIKQVWFAGVHADVGGGYPELESSLSKFPLDWMIEEAKRAGLKINAAVRNRLALGRAREGSTHNFVPPDPKGCLHNSMTAGWLPLEWVPRRTKWKEDEKRRSLGGWYLPRGEQRRIPLGARIHWSVVARKETDLAYRPPNLPSRFVVEE
jgi:uncharacterized protein (DUF2235 family)